MEQGNFSIEIIERNISGFKAIVNNHKIFLPYSQIISFEKFKLYVLERIGFLCYLPEPQEENYAALINEAISKLDYNGFLDYKSEISNVLRRGDATCLQDVLLNDKILVDGKKAIFRFDTLKARLKETGVFLSETQLSKILNYDFKAIKKKITFRAKNKVFSKTIWEVDLTNEAS